MYDLQCERLTKRFGQHIAVNDVSFDVPRGSFFSILGPSGCGKTTLMRMIAGFETPTGGDIRIKGASVLSTPPNRRSVKMVFQHLALFPMMNVGENIAYGLRCRGENKADIGRKVAAVLERIGLPDVAEKQVSQLSGGQKQRIAIARCMVLEPDVLLLDEPLGALDLKLRQEMQNELKAVQKRTGKTFVFVTHDQEEAMSMSDLVAVMNRGRIEQIASPREIYSRPATAFVAGFIGAANMLDAEVEGVDGDGIVLDIGGSRFRLPSSRLTSGRALRAGDAATVVIRPEQLAAGGRGQEQSLELQGRLEDVTFLGGRAHIRFVTATGQMILAEAPPSMADNVGDTVSFICGSNEMVVLAVDQK